jgi:L-fuculose-phosphate aldolase
VTPLDLRRQLVGAARRSVELGLNHGTTGNLSVRWRDVILVTPSGMPCDGLREEDLVAIGMDGTPAPGAGRPTSEWRLHLGIYRARPDVEAIVHAHPVFSTTLACCRLDLPAVHYMLAVAGTDRVRCAPYATFGTEVLSHAAVEALGRSKACLLANHGLVAVGDNPADALRVAAEVEHVAELYWRARQLGTPAILTPSEMDEVTERFRD